MAGGEPGAEVRRLDSGEIAKLLLLSVALVGYVYLAGWLVTWIRLAAARLPVDASLPMIRDKVLFASGLRMVVVIAVVFAAMCAFAYMVHAWTWNKRAPEWHSIVEQGRAGARNEAELPRLGEKLKNLRRSRPTLARLRGARPKVATLKFQSAPEDLQQAAIGDPFVRVVAGFNVGVLAVVIGLA